MIFKYFSVMLILKFCGNSWSTIRSFFDTCFLEETRSRKLASDSYLADFLFRVVVCPCSRYYADNKNRNHTPLYCSEFTRLELMDFLLCWCQYKQLIAGMYVMESSVSLTRPGRINLSANGEGLINNIVFWINCSGTWSLCLCSIYLNT